MANPYQEAKQALEQMAQNAESLNQDLQTLETLIQAEIKRNLLSNPLFDFRTLPDYPKWENALALRKKHIEWGRKIHGVIMGYGREMHTGFGALVKGRTIGFEAADVTVGTNENYAKAVQHKHTVSPENAQVNDMIAKAANQLTGESGEAPLATQRKIIDMMINDPQNWWPFDLANFNTIDPQADLADGVISLDLFKAAAASKILKQLSTYKQGKKGLNPTTQASLVNHVPTQQSANPAFSKNPNLPKSTALFLPNGQRADVLTIKIVYGQPRKFNNNGMTLTVRTAVFAAYNVNGQLKVEFQETK